jgi:hypothetical protein
MLLPARFPAEFLPTVIVQDETELAAAVRAAVMPVRHGRLRLAQINLLPELTPPALTRMFRENYKWAM